MSTLTCLQTRPLPRVRPRTRTPSRPYARRRTQHTPSYAMSLERADSCIVTLRDERTAHAADHHQRTRPESRTLTCVRTRGFRTRCLARERFCCHTCAGARNTRPRTHSSGHMRRCNQRRMHGGLSGRPLAAHAARIARSCMCPDANAAAHAASHANALTATYEQTRATHALARNVSQVR